MLIIVNKVTSWALCGGLAVLLLSVGSYAAKFKAQYSHDLLCIWLMLPVFGPMLADIGKGSKPLQASAADH